MDEVGQSIVGKLRGLGFTNQEIQYQFTGPWAAQPDRKLDESVLIPFVPGEPDLFINLRDMDLEEIAKLPKNELLDLIEKATGTRPAQRTNRAALAEQLVEMMEESK